MLRPKGPINACVRDLVPEKVLHLHGRLWARRHSRLCRGAWRARGARGAPAGGRRRRGWRCRRPLRRGRLWRRRRLKLPENLQQKPLALLHPATDVGVAQLREVGKCRHDPAALELKGQELLEAEIRFAAAPLDHCLEQEQGWKDEVWVIGRPTVDGHQVYEALSGGARGEFILQPQFRQRLGNRPGCRPALLLGVGFPREALRRQRLS
mmetsp:Transcript_42846/g.101710  ORF Transcript_42846/g.101710 Transcript_42846/m.101710 type:complete len:209 (+) Transcript_42846:423-1049(+)